MVAIQKLNVQTLLQGALQNQWFLGALACVSSRRDLVLDLIVSDNAADRGLYTFQFYKHGCWHHIAVDDMLPCAPGQDEVLFACSGTAGMACNTSCNFTVPGAAIMYHRRLLV